jgi:hypothetical protein
MRSNNLQVKRKYEHIQDATLDKNSRKKSELELGEIDEQEINELEEGEIPLKITKIKNEFVRRSTGFLKPPE